ncbi:MAG TPA: hypothetical protein VGR80_08865, partial [Steroidobacteraceae bacterium]|nr:hypothetical protein [Steroidobacteraceae bacterium]
MLRTLLLVCAGALALLGARLLFHGQTGGGLSAFGAGVVLLIGTVFERRYRSAAARPGAAWQPTGERFEDPQSGKTVAVLYDPVSGARRYIDDPQP